MRVRYKSIFVAVCTAASCYLPIGQIDHDNRVKIYLEKNSHIFSMKDIKNKYQLTAKNKLKKLAVKKF